MSEAIVKELNVYPVKACQGTSVEELTLTDRGVIGDRLFALVEDGQPIDQIRAPQLGGIEVDWNEETSTLVFSIQTAASLRIRVATSENFCQRPTFWIPLKGGIRATRWPLGCRTFQGDECD